MNPWEGKQLWIWELEQCGTPQDVVNKAAALGLTGLIVKGWDGGNYWSQIEQIIQPAHDAGLLIGAWGYSYGTNVTGEVAAAKRCLDAGADWLIIDAEAEYEQYPDRADSVLEALNHSAVAWDIPATEYRVTMPVSLGRSSLMLAMSQCRRFIGAISVWRKIKRSHDHWLICKPTGCQ